MGDFHYSILQIYFFVLLVIAFILILILANEFSNFPASLLIVSVVCLFYSNMHFCRAICLNSSGIFITFFELGAHYTIVSCCLIVLFRGILLVF